MKFITILLSLMGVFTLAHATNTTDSGLPYKLVPFQYTGTLGGHDVQLNGTARDIYAQMMELYPDFNPKLANKQNLGRRNKDGLLCCPVVGQSWVSTSAEYVQEDIGYIQALDRIYIEGRTCTRILCVNLAAVTLCNDNNYAINPDAGYIASYVQDLIYQCSGWDPRFTGEFSVCGQQFDSDRYNVIVNQATRCL